MIDPANTSAATQVDNKRRELKALDDELSVKKVQTEVAGQKEIAKVNEKNASDFVKISKEGEKMAETLKKVQHDQVVQLTENQNQSFQKLAKDTAEQFSLISDNAKDTINKLHLDSMGKVNATALMAEDPFYRLKSFDAIIKEAEKNYAIDIKLPPHEAKNLFLTAEGNIVKLSLARSYYQKADVTPDHMNRTSSYQTILESFQLPSKVDARLATREYKDGVLSILLPKI